MFAIVNIAGQQFKVEKGQEIFVHRLEANEGDKVTFEEVMLVDDKGNTQVGTPVLDVNVTATVLSHLKGNKVIVFILMLQLIGYGHFEFSIDFVFRLKSQNVHRSLI